MLAAIFISMSAGLVLFVGHFWSRFDALPTAVPGVSFPAWCLKGLLVPWVIITVFNTGFVPGLPPVLSRVPLGGAFGWSQSWDFFTQQCIQGFFIAQWWCAISLAWMLALQASVVDNRDNLLATLISWSLIGLPAAGLLFLALGWLNLGLALTGWLWALTHGVLNIMPTHPPKPIYSGAIGHLMMDRPEEAEWEVLKELEQFEEDYEGWMLMAGIYATQYRDVRLAEQTVFELLTQPTLSITEVAAALHKLADWHLSIAEDPAGARFALEEIGRRLPDSHLAREAQVRLERMPRTREELIESKQPRKIRLPNVQQVDDQTSKPWQPDLEPESAQAIAEDCVARLNREPNDVATREKLARLYAEHLGNAERGIEQLQLLLDMPDCSDAKAPEWLALMAHWQEHRCHNRPAARLTLRRLVEDFPRSLHAFAAHRRLRLMPKEEVSE